MKINEQKRYGRAQAQREALFFLPASLSHQDERLFNQQTYRYANMYKLQASERHAIGLIC